MTLYPVLAVTDGISEWPGEVQAPDANPPTHSLENRDYERSLQIYKDDPIHRVAAELRRADNSGRDSGRGGASPLHLLRRGRRRAPLGR